MYAPPWRHSPQLHEAKKQLHKDMRVNHLIARARHGMARAYDLARVAGGKLNNFIDTSARVYGGVIQPLLNQSGIDTAGSDMALIDMYRGYSNVRDAANKFDSIIKV